MPNKVGPNYVWAQVEYSVVGGIVMLATKMLVTMIGYCLQNFDIGDICRNSDPYAKRSDIDDQTAIKMSPTYFVSNICH